MLVFAESLPPRLQYAFGVLLEDVSNPLQFTSDVQEFEAYTGGKIWYSSLAPTTACIHLQPSSLLFQKELNRFKPEMVTWNHLPAIFPVYGGALPFDIAAAVFFLVSRFEEYWSFQSDDMGRFVSESSLSHRFGFLHRPIVDEWRIEFHQVLIQHFPSISISPRSFNFLSTIDIDHAYAFLHKGFYRTAGALARDVIQGRYKAVKERTKVLMGKDEDPYDTYDYIEKQHNFYGASSLFFFLVSDPGEFDTGLHYEHPKFRKLIQRISRKVPVGLHPSVGSHKRFNTIVREKSRLEHIVGKPCTASRQHYLLLKFRTTYRLLKAAGIKEDYSMGYHDNVGFRAGTARPFIWFDVKKDEVSSLRVHPIMVMDTTLRKYLELDFDQAKDLTERIMRETHKVGGQFVSLWHNETLSNYNEWTGWRQVWERTLQCARELSS